MPKRRVTSTTQKRQLQALATALEDLRFKRMCSDLSPGPVAGPSFVRDPVVYYGQCRAKAGSHRCLKQLDHSGKHATMMSRWVGYPPPPREVDWSKYETVLIEFPALSVESRSATWSSLYTASRITSAWK